jgi:phage baseplate assembly protein W
MVQFRGIAFPFQKGRDSLPAKAEDEELIRMSILQILSTQKGERVMRPEFGANVWRFVFANNNTFLVDLIRTEVKSAINRFEPRVAVTRVLTQQRDSEIVITIEYVIRATKKRQVLDFVEPSPR